MIDRMEGGSNCKHVKINMVITTILSLLSACRNLICEKGVKGNYEESAF